MRSYMMAAFKCLCLNYACQIYKLEIIYSTRLEWKFNCI